MSDPNSTLGPGVADGFGGNDKDIEAISTTNDQEKNREFLEKLQAGGGGKSQSAKSKPAPSPKFTELNYELSRTVALNQCTLSGNIQAALGDCLKTLEWVDATTTKQLREILWVGLEGMMKNNQAELEMLASIFKAFFNFDVPEISNDLLNAGPGNAFARNAFMDLPSDLIRELNKEPNAKEEFFKKLEIYGNEMAANLDDGLSKQEKHRLMAQAGSLFGSRIKKDSSILEPENIGTEDKPKYVYHISYIDNSGTKIDLNDMIDLGAQINYAFSKSAGKEGSDWPFTVKNSPRVSAEKAGPEGKNPGNTPPSNPPTPPRAGTEPTAADKERERQDMLEGMFRKADLTPEQFNELFNMLGKRVDIEQRAYTDDSGAPVLDKEGNPVVFYKHHLHTLDDNGNPIPEQTKTLNTEEMVIALPGLFAEMAMDSDIIIRLAEIKKQNQVVNNIDTIAANVSGIAAEDVEIIKISQDRDWLKNKVEKAQEARTADPKEAEAEAKQKLEEAFKKVVDALRQQAAALGLPEPKNLGEKNAVVKLLAAVNAKKEEQRIDTLAAEHVGKLGLPLPVKQDGTTFTLPELVAEAKKNPAALALLEREAKIHEVAEKIVKYNLLDNREDQLVLAKDTIAVGQHIYNNSADLSKLTGDVARHEKSVDEISATFVKHGELDRANQSKIQSVRETLLTTPEAKELEALSARSFEAAEGLKNYQLLDPTQANLEVKDIAATITDPNALADAEEKVAAHEKAVAIKHIEAFIGHDLDLTKIVADLGDDMNPDSPPTTPAPNGPKPQTPKAPPRTGP